MNHQSFLVEKLAKNHYYRLFKVRLRIDNSQPKNISKINYTTRNLTHMYQYQENLKTQKLLKKLIEINNGNNNVKLTGIKDQNNQYKKIVNKNNEDNKKRKRKRKSNSNSNSKRSNSKISKLQQDDILLSKGHTRSFMQSKVNKQKILKIDNDNIKLVGKLLDLKSTYNKCFTSNQQRQEKLKRYRKILSKRQSLSKQQNKIRGQIFEAYEKIKLSQIIQHQSKRPKTGVSSKRKKSYKGYSKIEKEVNSSKERPTTGNL